MDESARNAARTDENVHFVGIRAPLTFQTRATPVLSVVGNASVDLQLRDNARLEIFHGPGKYLEEKCTVNIATGCTVL